MDLCLPPQFKIDIPERWHAEKFFFYVRVQDKVRALIHRPYSSFCPDAHRDILYCTIVMFFVDRRS